MLSSGVKKGRREKSEGMVLILMDTGIIVFDHL